MYSVQQHWELELVTKSQLGEVQMEPPNAPSKMVSPQGGGLHALPVVLQRVVVVVESYGPHKVRDRLSLALREPYALFSMPTLLEFQSYPRF